MSIAVGKAINALRTGKVHFDSLRSRCSWHGGGDEKRKETREVAPSLPPNPLEKDT